MQKLIVNGCCKGGTDMKKWLSCLLAAMLIVISFAGCGGSADQMSKDTDSGVPAGGNEAASGETTADTENKDVLTGLPETLMDGEVKAAPEMYPNVDFSKAGTVHLYMIGDTPQDWDRILAEINAYLEPFNTTLETVIISWADMGTMYSLSLAGGEEIDLVYTAPWCYMYTEAAKGSFYAMDRSFISQNMPLTDKYQAETSYAEATVDGKIIAIPSNLEKADTKIVAIRQDLAEKHGIEKLENWDDYMNFMLTMAEKETPESGILAQASSGNNAELWEVYRQQYDMFYLLKDNNLHYQYQYKEGEIPSVEDIELCWNSEAFLNFAKDMKTLADAGCWSRGALSGTVSDDDAFGALQGASIAWNGTVFNYMRMAEKNEGVKCMAYDLTKDHLVSCEEFNNNDMAIATATKDPYRSAMVLDILKMDTYVSRLLTLGIENDHYTINGYEYTRGANAEAYAPNSVSASWGVNNGIYEENGVEAREKEMVDSWEPRITSNPTVTFVFNDKEVTDYASACKAVMGDYIPSLQLGLVDDVEAYLAEMNAKLEEAGIAKIEEELFRQYTEWAATR